MILGIALEAILLERYSSQTYRPGHDNFTEKFIFEPRLEEGIDSGAVSELQALDVKEIDLFFCRVNPEVKLIGFDDKVRAPTK
jgi:hypothetical protein